MTASSEPGGGMGLAWLISVDYTVRTALVVHVLQLPAQSTRAGRTILPLQIGATGLNKTHFPQTSGLQLLICNAALADTRSISGRLCPCVTD
ncbi:MAG: hypothetical protein RQ741_03600 [Wenzhouxiangellaceae bacterium]|nr:hypothetical protein [Wenzhouxiangellaceae bacterium]